MRLAAIAVIFGCAGGTKPSGRTDGSSDDTAGGQDSGASLPREAPCEEATNEAQPLPASAESVELPCGGGTTRVKVYPQDAPSMVAFTDDGWCDGEAEAGAVHVADAGSFATLAMMQWDEAVPGSGGGNMRLGPSNDGAVLLARSRRGSDGSYGSVVEVRDATTGEFQGAIDGQGVRISAGLSFAGTSLLMDAPYNEEGTAGPGEVYHFEPPWKTAMTLADASAVHHHPYGCDDCMFGVLLDTLGDVTGDGVDDAVMGGGGFWFVDGELLAIDEGASSGIELNASGVVLDEKIENVGDFNGDGLDDWATATDGNAHYGAGLVEILAGGYPEPFARIVGPPGPYLYSGGLGRVGDLDGDGLGTMAVVAEYWGDEPNPVFLVEGGLCGTYEFLDVATELESDGEVGTLGIAAGDGLLVLPTYRLTTEEDEPGWLRVKRW